MADAGCNHIFGRYPSTAHAIWRATGDRGVISRHLANIVRYVESLATGVRRTGLANMHTKYGDWLPPPEAPTPSKPLCSAAAFIHDLGLVEEMAAAIGNTTVAARVSQLRSSTASAFNAIWLRNGTYASGRQTELALPLWLGIVPDSARDAVIDNLVREIEAHEWHVTTGIVGTRALFEALGLIGRTDVALRLLTQTSCERSATRTHAPAPT